MAAPGPTCPSPVSGAAEGAVDGVILLSGGEDPGAGLIIDRHWSLDTNAGAGATWLALAPPPLTVHGAPGVILDGRFIIAGGSPRPAASRAPPGQARRRCSWPLPDRDLALVVVLRDRLQESVDGEQQRLGRVLGQGVPDGVLRPVGGARTARRGSELAQ